MACCRYDHSIKAWKWKPVPEGTRIFAFKVCGMERAYSYERVSSAQQVTGRGLGRQSDAALRWADAHGCTLDTSLQLSDQGRSASKGHHLTKGALGRFLQLAQAGQLGTSPLLLVEAIDRLSRQEPLDAIETILTGLVGSGVRIITLEDGAEYSRETLRTDPTKLLVLVVKMQAAYEYSARLAMRMRDSWQGARAKLKSGQLVRPKQFCPAWCSYSAEVGFVVYQDKAAVVREVFALLRHQGAYATAKELNSRGLLSPAGNRWTAASVRSLAINADGVYGAVRLLSKRHHGPKGQAELIEGLLPVIVPKAEVLAVRALMAQRANTQQKSGPNGSTKWIGQGLSYCVCGARVGLSKGGSPKNRIDYLRCHHKVSHADGCQRSMVVAADATAHLLRRLEPEQLALLVAAAQQSATVGQQEATVKTCEAEVRLLQQQRSNTTAALKQAAKAGLEVLALVTAQQEVEADLKRAEQGLAGAKQQLQAMTNAVVPNEPVQAFREAVALGRDTAEQRRAVNCGLRELGLRIVLDGDRQQMGLQVASGPLEWQPIRALDRRLLWAGRRLAEVDGLMQEQ